MKLENDTNSLRNTSQKTEGNNCLKWEDTQRVNEQGIKFNSTEIQL